MTKSLPLPIALLSALAAAACAHQPPTSLSAELNVMQMASDLGYSTPRVINGKTFFCQREELTGSLVPKEACLSEDQVVAEARAQGDLIKYVLKPPNNFSRPPGS